MSSSFSNKHLFFTPRQQPESSAPFDASLDNEEVSGSSDTNALGCKGKVRATATVLEHYMVVVCIPFERRALGRHF